MREIVTIKYIKELMSYTEDKPVRCKTCKHFSSKGDPGYNLIETCNLNQVIDIPVRSDGRCSFHKLDLQLPEE